MPGGPFWGGWGGGWGGGGQNRAGAHLERAGGVVGVQLERLVSSLGQSLLALVAIIQGRDDGGRLAGCRARRGGGDAGAAGAGGGGGQHIHGPGWQHIHGPGWQHIHGHGWPTCCRQLLRACCCSSQLSASPFDAPPDAILQVGCRGARVCRGRGERAAAPEPAEQPRLCSAPASRQGRGQEEQQLGQHAPASPLSSMSASRQSRGRRSPRVSWGRAGRLLTDARLPAATAAAGAAASAEPEVAQQEQGAATVCCVGGSLAAGARRHQRCMGVGGGKAGRASDATRRAAGASVADSTCIRRPSMHRAQHASHRAPVSLMRWAAAAAVLGPSRSLSASSASSGCPAATCASARRRVSCASLPARPSAPAYAASICGQCRGGAGLRGGLHVCPSARGGGGARHVPPAGLTSC